MVVSKGLPVFLSTAQQVASSSLIIHPASSSTMASMTLSNFCQLMVSKVMVTKVNAK